MAFIIWVRQKNYRLEKRDRSIKQSLLYSAPKPFDRHDWYISRCGQSRRYVIDYYEAPEDVPGVPVFHLDVRPALDDTESVMVRFKEAAKVKWDQWFPTVEKTT